MLYQQERLVSCGWCRVNNLVITHTLVHNVHKDTFDAVRSIFHATSHMTAAGRRTERALSEWAWLILVLVNSQCSGADICAWMRQRRQSKRGDEAAFCLSGGCESMRQNWMLFWINEAPQPKATRQRGAWKCNFFFVRVVIVVSSLTVMDGADMLGWRKYSDYIRGRKSFETAGDTKKDIQKTKKRKWTTETFWKKVRKHFTARIHLLLHKYKQQCRVMRQWL